MYLHALILLCVIGAVLAFINLLYMFLQKRKYNLSNDKTKNSKNKNAKSMRDINNQVKSNFIKAVLKTKIMQSLLIIDGFFYNNLNFNCCFCLNLIS